MKYLLIIVMMFSSLFWFSCAKEESQTSPTTETKLMEDLTINDDFNFETTQKVEVKITVKSNNKTLAHVPVKIYAKDPETTEFSASSSKVDAKVLASGITNAQGYFKTSLNLPTSVKKLYFVPNYIGVMNKGEVEVNGDYLEYTFENLPSKKTVVKNGKSFTTIGFNTMGDWDANGVPNYLMDPDIISETLLSDIRTSLPEGNPLPNTHPEYLADGIETNIVLNAEAEVWITFVHEGAGWKNTLGYYTYDADNPPTEEPSIDELTIIFPNTSFDGSGGGLHSGDKVYLGEFPANTVISWFLVAKGWKKHNASIDQNAYRVYSNNEFNPENSDNLKQHTVLLYHEVEDIFILGVEDINRTWGMCDHDFNDAVFYAKVSPEGAVDTEDVPEADVEIEDADDDGVPDEDDDYPNDPEKAFDNYTPAKDLFSTLAYEDLWPSKGDYDFNDLVLDYNFNQITNADNKVVEIESKLVIRATGAGFHNGFGFELPVLASEINSVEGYVLNDNYISLNANGTESGQANAVIIAFDDTYDILKHPGAGNGTGVNTTLGATYVEPLDTIKLTIKLDNPTDVDNFLPPYNSFLIKNGNRDYEVHLPNYEPTDLAVMSYLGTNDDDSNPIEGRYYKSKTNLPWAINIPVSFDYPIEKEVVILPYLFFEQWVESNGTLYEDWYTNTPGYRNDEYIYSH